jgi:hypothetical protein
MKKLKNIFKKFEELKFFDFLLIFFIMFILISALLVLSRNQQWITIVLKIHREEWFTNLLHPGMKEKNILGQTMAEITKINIYPSPDKKKIIHLTIKLKTIFSKANQKYTYKGNDIMIGSYLDNLQFDNLLIDGLIIDINNINNNNFLKNRKKIFVKARLMDINPAFPYTEGVIPFIANSINEGEKMYDSLSRPAIIIKKKTVQSAKIIVPSFSGNLYLQENPLRFDVFLDLEVYAYKIGQWYYLFGDENYPIVIGNSIPFSSKNNWVFLTITEIKDENK